MTSQALPAVALINGIIRGGHDPHSQYVHSYGNWVNIRFRAVPSGKRLLVKVVITSQEAQIPWAETAIQYVWILRSKPGRKPLARVTLTHKSVNGREWLEAEHLVKHTPQVFYSLKPSPPLHLAP